MEVCGRPQNRGNAGLEYLLKRRKLTFYFENELGHPPKKLFLNNYLKDNLFFSPMPCLSAGPLTAPCLVWAFPARLCGFIAPDPVLSSSGVMLISFQSDENVTFRGFQATVSFIPETGKKTETSVLGSQFPSS